MKREPSLHITKGNLERILSDILPEGVCITSISDMIFLNATPYSISSRTVVPSNKRVEKKIEKIVKGSRLDGDIFANLLYIIRKKLKHKGINQIKPGTKDWDTIKILSNKAIDFCNDFNLEKKTGFAKYIEIGISRIGQKFNLNRLLSLNEVISDIYESSLEVDSDDEPDLTLELYKLYSKHIMDQTGIFEDFSKEPEKYVWFVRARKQAKQINIALNLYIEAQFEGLDFTRGIPYPSQLVGPKANQRIYQYLYKRGLKIDNNRG